jgi:pantoate kinase
LDEECAVQEEVSLECMEFGTWIDKMTVMRDLIGTMDKSSKYKAASVLKNIKLHTPQSAVSENANRPELDRALAEARLATETHGITSSEAKLAWETYEEIAASGTANAMGTNLMDECSLEVGQEACQAMEELERVMPVLLAISSDSKN